MKYNPDVHHRRSIRLRNYDYASNGYYFVTICTHEREPTCAVADAREIMNETWLGLSGRFPTIELDEFVVMEDHVHGIVILTLGAGPTLGRVATWVGRGKQAPLPGVCQ